MKTPIISKNNIQSFGLSTKTVSTIKKETKTSELVSAFKELAEQFKTVNEIGRFEKIKIMVSKPLKDSSIDEAYLIIEPSANKNDFRTRVLSFVAVSPDSDTVKRSICQATGNKFAIDSVLKNSSTITAFKNFIKDSELFFLK